jgi:hypothetical protein
MWINVALHVAGLGLAAIWMRPGTPAVAPAARLEYLERAPLGWALGWATWMLCAVALLAFVVQVVDRAPGSGVVGRLAVALCTAGLAVDLTCDAVYIVVVPRLAAAADATELFLAFERMASVGGLVVANGSYSVSVLLVTATIRAPGRWIAALGIGTWAAGMAMVTAGFLQSPRLVELSTGPTIVSFCAWAWAVAQQLDPPNRASPSR